MNCLTASGRRTNNAVSRVALECADVFCCFEIIFFVIFLVFRSNSSRSDSTIVFLMVYTYVVVFFGSFLGEFIWPLLVDNDTLSQSISSFDSL